jgi:hypothetical protein
VVYWLPFGNSTKKRTKKSQILTDFFFPPGQMVQKNKTEKKSLKTRTAKKKANRGGLMSLMRTITMRQRRNENAEAAI